MPYPFQAVSFKKTSRNLARSLWWKNIKITIIIVVVVIVSKSFILYRAKLEMRISNWENISFFVVVFSLIFPAMIGMVWSIESGFANIHNMS